MAIHELKETQVSEELIAELIERLAAEIARPEGEASPPGAPVVCREPGYRDNVHLYVIWDAFKVIPADSRPHLILDACEQALGRPFMLKVSMAMGLTREQADEMGIEPVS